jgi:hypothetical protein
VAAVYPRVELDLGAVGQADRVVLRGGECEREDGGGEERHHHARRADAVELNLNCQLSNDLNTYFFKKQDYRTGDVL